MKKFIPFLLATFIMLLVPLSSVDAQAGGFIPCNGPDCTACDLVSMINRIIIWLFGIVFIIFAIMMVIAGFGLVTSKGNQSALDAAKDKFQNAIIGIIIMMSAWLIVDTLLRAILAGGGGNVLGYGPWSQVQCYVQNESSQYVPTRPGTSTFDTPTPTTPTSPTTPVTGDVSGRIASASQSMTGMSTAAGPADGALACAWAVNRVLNQAGIASINGDSVVSMQNQLNNGRGQSVSQSQARAGDLVLVTGARTSSGSTNANHVGICQNDGCTRVISNSSSRRAFSWQSGPNFAPSYVNATPQFYRVNN